jgi:hypothetical protein
MLPPFFNFDLSSPSEIAACNAFHAILGFRRQYCSGGCNSDKYIFVMYFHNFSSVFRNMLKKGRGLFNIT